jgi:hypothetical protein
MIRRGRSEGWLRLPIDTLPAWSKLNNVVCDGVKVGPLPGQEERGSTLIAERPLTGSQESALVVVPSDLVLSLAHVSEHAKLDQDFREILSALGDFGRVGSFCVF